MRKYILAVLIAVFTIFNSMCFAEIAPESQYAVEVKLLKNVVSPDEPIYASLVVKNLSNSYLPVYATIPPPYPPLPPQQRPLVTYRLSVESVTYDSAKELCSTAGPMQSDIITVFKHSVVTLWTFDIKRIFGNYLPPLTPGGIYSVTLRVGWEGVGSFHSNVIFVVEEKKDGPILEAIKEVNTNVGYTQDKVVETKNEVLANRTYLVSIFNVIKSVKTVLGRTYGYVQKIYARLYPIG